MWPLRTKRHLRYPSVEAWFKGEGLKEPVFKIADPVERDRRITEYGELRQHLFAKHTKTLSPEEQREFKEFLDRLRFAKDKTEFDQFMAERRRRPENPEGQPQG